MAYYGTNSVLAQAHWDASQSSNSYFDLKQSFGCSSVTKIANGHYRLSFSSTLDDDYYVVCGSMSSEKAAKIIFSKINSNIFEIYFPKMLLIPMKILSFLPYRIYFYLIKKFVKLPE